VNSSTLATAVRRPVALLVPLALALSPSLAQAAVAARPAPYAQQHGGRVTVAAGDTWTVSSTTRLRSLTVEKGGAVVAPDGSAITLSVNGVETGQRLVTTDGVDTAIQPGTYRGDVVLSVTRSVTTTWSGTTFPLRQALYLGSDGVDTSKSALAAIAGGRVGSAEASGLRVVSTGEDFNGVNAEGGSYTLEHPSIRLDGNGRYDFVGAGAGIRAAGAGTRLVVDGADVDNHGVVRTGAIATDGANLVVKNSSISTHDGTLPSDYQPTLMPGQMRSAPWMIGVVGNVRATNLVGTNTKATYVDSRVYSSGWGVLSTDSTQNGQLTAIDTDATTGSEGYGTYADGQTVTDRFLGTRFKVADYGAISTGGDIYFGDSDRADVAALNDALDIGLSAKELKAVKDRATTIDSGRFGVMWHGGGQTDVDGGTVTVAGRTAIRTGQTAFLDKGLQVHVDLDGSDGATVKAGNGVLWQLMDSDDPGPVFVDGKLVNQGVYTEPTGDPV
jgi:hypothetical protein